MTLNLPEPSNIKSSILRKKRSLWLTPTARAKLKAVYAYSHKEWGKSTASNYMAALNKAMELVANGATQTTINPPFSTRFSYCIAERHLIFFEYQDNRVIVATLFHSAMNVKERLAEETLTIKHEVKAL